MTLAHLKALLAVADQAESLTLAGVGLTEYRRILAELIMWRENLNG